MEKYKWNGVSCVPVTPGCFIYEDASKHSETAILFINCDDMRSSKHTKHKLLIRIKGAPSFACKWLQVPKSLGPRHPSRFASVDWGGDFSEWSCLNR
jgi:hypothetical protein